ncbi:hypothetical protein IMZ48_22745 [Candidatus Bathyarchaeota archaeon]|nr:hypothetical protein [Candidatus Bathyarchaeota archaeon]
MSQPIKSSLPSHLKNPSPSRLSPDSAAGGEGDDQFERHHGKTRSHMVSHARPRVEAPAPASDPDLVSARCIPAPDRLRPQSMRHF